MPDLRDFLTRFRPVGTPGAATARGGVPADRVAEREAELAPVLALLAETQRDAERVRREAADQAGQRRLQGREEADAVLAEARRRSGAEWDAAAARVVRLTADERRRAEAAASRRGAEIRTLAAERMPAMVDRALGPLLAMLDPRAPVPGEAHPCGPAPVEHR